MTKHIYLRKANDEGISHCRCVPADALISSPCQMDCPWCGCGWLFICSRCRKAFTFAESVEVSESWQETAERTIRSLYQREPKPDEVKEWIGFMKILLKGVRLGERYVYLDGWVVSAAANGIHIDGWHSRHDLDIVPHVVALDNSEISPRLLESREYWLSTAIKVEDN